MNMEKIIERIKRKYNLSDEDVKVFARELRALIKESVKTEDPTKIERLRKEYEDLLTKYKTVLKENQELKKRLADIEFELQLKEVLEEAQPFIHDEADLRMLNILIEGIRDIDLIRKKVAEFIEIKQNEQKTQKLNISETADLLHIKEKARRKVVETNSWDEYVMSMLPFVDDKNKNG